MGKRQFNEMGNNEEAQEKTSFFGRNPLLWRSTSKIQGHKEMHDKCEVLAIMNPIMPHKSIM